MGTFPSASCSRKPPGPVRGAAQPRPHGGEWDLDNREDKATEDWKENSATASDVQEECCADPSWVLICSSSARCELLTCVGVS